MKDKVKTQPSRKATAGKNRVFLDYASVTPVCLEVEKEMLKIQHKFWANPSSLHTEGETTKNILIEARTKIAQILHCRANEIVFTSGGTESLNLAIQGIVRVAKNLLEDDHQGKPHIITSTIEHPAVLESIRELVKKGEVETTFVYPDQNGKISPESIKKELKENTVLVVVQHANNEIGTIQPIRKISEIIHKSRIINQNSFPYLLVDACQSALYEDISLERLGADLLVLDGIKMYGPRGIGVLAIKHNVKISPIIFGGGQENSLRSGTENVVGIAGLAKALEIATKKREQESKRLKVIRDYVIAKILKEIPNSSLNGGLENRLPNNINICFAVPKLSAQAGQKLDSEFLVIKLDTLGFAVSAASACHTLTLENGSYVIEALGKKECASSSLRITMGRDTQKSDLDKFIATLKKIIK